MKINRYCLSAALLSFLSLTGCDLLLSDKNKEALGKVYAALQSDGGSATGTAEVKLTKEKVGDADVYAFSGNAGLEVATASGVSKMEVAAVGAGSVSRGRVSGGAVVSSTVGSTTGAVVGGTAVYTDSTDTTGVSVSGHSDAVELTENSSPNVISGGYSDAVEAVEDTHLSGSGIPGAITGGGGTVEESYYYPSPFVISGSNAGEATVVEDYNAEEEEERATELYNSNLEKTKENVDKSLGSVKKILSDYDSFSSHNTTSRSSRNWDSEGKRKAAKKASEYTKERLKESLRELEDSVMQALVASIAGEGDFVSDLKVKDKLDELQKTLRGFVREVEASQGSAYGEQSGTRQGELLKMQESLEKVKNLLEGLSNNSNIGD
nr:hypothetical protein LKV13_04800 [Borrelia sp. BU AG58]